MEQGKQLGDWKCMGCLGKGNFGVVGLWKNLKTGESQAIKKFEVRNSFQLKDSGIIELQKRWEKEVEMMYQDINCPYIVSTVAVPNDLAISSLAGPPNLPLLSMEYCSGGDLRQVLRRPENISGLREKEVVTILDHTSKAIVYLHENKIVHRDLKPDNILVYYESPTKIIYKLSDLGVAKGLSNSDSQCSTLVGTAQYLAPEIYLGKKYDKTVDYWSFGVIAFEIICGKRPFLQDSAVDWLNLLDKKGRDIIAIYRDADGKIESCTEIPFYTHCSDSLKKCLESWLATLLQFDPICRGKKVTDCSSSSGQETGSPTLSSPIVSFTMLSTILNTRSLQILTPPKRMAYYVGTNTKISKVKEWISRDTGISTENSLIITMDGIEVKETDNAATFIELSDLFLIPCRPNVFQIKWKMPKNVKDFLTSSSNLSDPGILSRVWTNAIHFVQTELEKLETTKKSSEALKTWCATYYTNHLKALRNEIEKSGAILTKILELETKLDNIENGCSNGFLNVNTSQGKDDTDSKVISWTQEMTHLQNVYTECVDNWVENVVLKPVRSTGLEEIYHNILKSCGDWKSAENCNASNFNQFLVKGVCQFVVQRDHIADDLLHNINIQLEKVESDVKLIETMKNLSSQLDQLTSDIIQTRCTRQACLVQQLQGKEPLSNGKLSETRNTNVSPTYSSIQPRSPNPNPIRGGGYHKNSSSDQMSQSAFSGPLISNKLPKPTIMAKSVNSGLYRSNQPIHQLMEESQMLKSQTETTMKSLQDSMEEVRNIIKQNAAVSWDFLN